MDKKILDERYYDYSTKGVCQQQLIMNFDKINESTPDEWLEKDFSKKHKIFRFGLAYMLSEENQKSVNLDLKDDWSEVINLLLNSLTKEELMICENIFDGGLAEILLNELDKVGSIDKITTIDAHKYKDEKLGELEIFSLDGMEKLPLTSLKSVSFNYVQPWYS